MDFAGANFEPQTEAFQRACIQRVAHDPAITWLPSRVQRAQQFDACSAELYSTRRDVSNISTVFQRDENTSLTPSIEFPESSSLTVAAIEDLHLSGTDADVTVVRSVMDAVCEGEQVMVQVINIESTGKIRLSRNALLHPADVVLESEHP